MAEPMEITVCFTESGGVADRGKNESYAGFLDMMDTIKAKGEKNFVVPALINHVECRRWIVLFAFLF